MNEAVLTRSPTDIFIEEPKICGHKIKTKECALLLIGIFCLLAGGVMMIVGIIGTEGHLVAILGTLVVILGIVTFSFSISLLCCKKRREGHKKTAQHNKPIVKGGITLQLPKKKKKLAEQSQPMIQVDIVNEDAKPEAEQSLKENDHEDEEEHETMTSHDVTDMRAPLTPSASENKRISTSSSQSDKRKISTSTRSSATEMV
ncbi:uncharacterized protein LOC100370540 [Saccoglossus kowalevskii]|uniref:Uncharacterized protein LOC100370540 n=1 Tax=Saccoglossus kowalevskii TaxID=10224 RepID=A0ABM0LXH8_SACKO|nr:PREDICTED: uncharacterized protein LOC100370540 [Saccoglossus kowalevskii]